MIKTILFDLDGTLLKMDAKGFEKAYLASMAKAVAPWLEPKQFVGALWSATEAMVLNDGKQTNEACFMAAFEPLVGSAFADIIRAIEAYYHNGFEAVQATVQPSVEMLDSLAILHQKGMRMIVATNPLFPKIAVSKRFEWGRLNWSDFDYVTHYENSHYCKPNLAYYQEIIDTCGVDPKTCLMVGNDVQEDMIASALGMRTFLVEDECIHRGGEVTADFKGKRSDFLEFVKTL